MPIRPFLNGEQVDQETLRVLGVAFEQVCIRVASIEGRENLVTVAVGQDAGAVNVFLVA
jgi:hypothetical protein